MAIDKKFLAILSIADINYKFGSDVEHRKCSVFSDDKNLYFDSRSDCYKKLIKNPPKKIYRGLGDIIEAVTEKTGIKAAVEYAERKGNFDCGCNRRKKRLNRAFPRK